MRGLARSTSIRIAAVLVLLALRPCLVASSVALVNACSPDAALQYIAAEEAVRHLVPNRQIWATAAVTTMALGAAVLSALPIRLADSFAAPAAFAACSLTSVLGEVLGSRAPPL